MKLLRCRAAVQDRHLKDVINEALRIGLDAGQPRRKRHRFRSPVTRGRLIPGLDLNNRLKLFDRMAGASEPTASDPEPCCPKLRRFRR